MSAPEKDQPQLNASQRRSVEALLESLEGTLTQVERLLRDGPVHESRITEMVDDLPAAFRQRANERIAAIRSELNALAERMQVTPRRLSRKRTVRGILSAQMVRVEDITPARLRNYGEVHPSVGEQISPALKKLQVGLSELIHLMDE